MPRGMVKERGSVSTVVRHVGAGLAMVLARGFLSLETGCPVTTYLRFRGRAEFCQGRIRFTCKRPLKVPIMR